ncbi:hypothetical protein Pst134EA_033087 [Puccinia striiformis f. sp. tritici]|nr:hypothetical protein Pst134EA_033087 [Puccinia striiformis f. sp. tritici]KAH9455700.1 hypothetical protein Pst134EA_033087 [Puccinia striiformis f. sp. tritici]
MKNPKAGAFKLKIGQPNGNSDSGERAASIHPSLVNSDRLRYYRKLVLTEMGYVPERHGAGVGDKFITDMFHWNERGLKIISCSFMEGEEHFTFQTQWMSARILARGNNREVYTGGLLSDVTYRFFENGYLLSTSIFCDQISRWIPVQLSWIRGLAENYYKVHFTILFRQFIIPSLTPSERETLARQVVDFSMAQKEGFVMAFMEVFGEADRSRALKHLKGCHEHFRAQVTRIRRNRNIVSIGEETNFERMCLALLDRPGLGELSHEEKIDELRRRFPKAKRWLDWWTASDVEAMLFPSRRPLLEDSPDGDGSLPNTTNAQESMHRLYYMISAGKKSMLLGMVELFAFVKVLEEDFDAVMQGVSIEYGSQTKCQTNVAQLMGWPKPKKRKRHAYINDGRAPDTTEALALSEFQPSSKRSKKLGRPKGSANIDRNPFTTYPSYSASIDPQRRNRCWMATALEALYALYSPLWLRGTKGTGKDLYSALCHHFNSRVTYELTELGQIRSVLSKGQSKIFNLARDRYEGSFVAGNFASCDFFIETLLDTEKNSSKSLKGLFTINDNRNYTCLKHPDYQHENQSKARALFVVTIKKNYFESNSIAPSNVADLINRWTSTGLQINTGMHCRTCIASDKQKSNGLSQHQVEPLSATSRLSFPADVSPPHLYFFLEVTSIFGDAQQRAFMAVQDWPAKLNVGGQIYTLISRGYWSGAHYKCKVVRNVGGSVGVWLHDDQENAGNARLINTDPAAIGGTSPDTSFLMYSRSWTGDEDDYIQPQIQKIVKDNPGAKRQLRLRTCTAFWVSLKGAQHHRPAGKIPKFDLWRMLPIWLSSLWLHRVACLLQALLILTGLKVIPT